MTIKHFISVLFIYIISASSQLYAVQLVDSDWLTDHKTDKNIKILEVRYHPHRYYTIGHIPGAIQVQRFKDLGDNFGIPLMRFPSKSQFQNTLRRWGINNNSILVLYDDSRTALVSRLHFLLELYGFNMKNVYILNGGTLDWTAFEELSKNKTKVKRGNVILSKAKKNMVVEWTDVYDDVVSRRDPHIILLDARPNKMYTGEIIKHAIEGGHIPGAINIVSLDGTDGESQKWLSNKDLKIMYNEIPKDKTIYVYCHDGFRMSLAYIQLKHLGYNDVRLYNGGWSHWGNQLSLPIVKGNKPYDVTFDL